MTLRAQWLGRQLRELRESAGLLLKDAGEHLGKDGTTVSRYEAGLIPARPDDVRALLDLYGVADTPQRDALLELAAEVWRVGWWDNYAGNLAQHIVDYAWLESRARRIRSFEVSVVFGLLQTPAYMSAVIRGADPTAALSASGARFRLKRQEILAAADPPHIEAILDESVLYRAPGGRAVLEEQLRHLIKLAAYPNIEVRVLPFSATTLASPEGSFLIFDMPEPYPEIGYADTPGGGIYIEGSGVQQLMLKYDRIRQDCLDSAESIELIRATADKLARS
jgi:transcriptional regulator with XRE-family HTH domain|nr:MAG: transcriptional regulator [Actinomycetota bacterium]